MEKLDKRYQKLLLFFRDIAKTFKLTEFKDQKKFLKAVGNVDGHRKLLLSAGRRSGKSFTLAVICLWYALCVSKMKKESLRICIVAGSLAQSREVMRYINLILNKHLWMRKRIGKDSTQKLKRSQTKVTFKDDSSIEALATSIRSITGKGANLLVVDEASCLTKTGNVIITRSFMKDFIEPLTWTKFSRIIMSSTPYIYDSFFVDCYLDKNEGYKVFRWDLKERKDLPKSIFEEAKREGDAHYKIQIEGKPARVSKGVLTSMFLKPLIRTKEEISKLVEDSSSARIAGIDFASVGITGLVVIDFNPADTEFPFKVLLDKGFEEIDNDKLAIEISYYLRKLGVQKAICDSNLPSKLHALKKAWKGEVKGQSFQHGAGFLMNMNMKEIILGKKILFTEAQSETKVYDYNKHLVGQLLGYGWKKDISKIDDLLDALMLSLSEQSDWLHKHPELRLEQSKSEMDAWISEVKPIMEQGWKVSDPQLTKEEKAKWIDQVPEEVMTEKELAIKQSRDRKLSRRKKSRKRLYDPRRD